MTTISEWIATRRKAYATAKPGPWDAKTDRRGSRWLVDAPYRLGLVTEVADVWDLDDAQLIVDARVSLPIAVDALDAIQHLHQPTSDHDQCRRCLTPWPCDERRILARVLATQVDP